MGEPQDDVETNHRINSLSNVAMDDTNMLANASFLYEQLAIYFSPFLSPLSPRHPHKPPSSH